MAISANFCYRLSLALLALLTAFTPCAVAQRTASVRPAAAARPTTLRSNLSRGSFAFGRGTHPSRGLRRSSSYASPYTSLPFSFFGDSFNPDDIYSTGYPVASQPPAFLLPVVRALSGSADVGRSGSDREPSSEPMMIELQNGRYVRVTSPAADGDALPLTLPPDNVHPKDAQLSKSTGNYSTRLVTPSSSTTQAGAIAVVPAHDLPPVVLVFRDGHSEEVRDYAIADGILYARGDFYTDAYWNKKIDLSTLDVSQTRQVNTSRNVKFVLPSSANEVITRP